MIPHDMCSPQRLTLAVIALLAAFGPIGCGQDAPPPPPTANTVAVQPVAVQPAPPGLMSITVTATSNPPEAKVTGGGRPLGVTPLTTQVPIPAPAPGQPAPSFDFVFEKEGYQSATISASPVNGMINITAALAPTAPAGGAAPRELEVVGTGGGAITDHHTTAATATVAESCMVEELTVVLRGNHSYHQDLVVTLRSPTGQSFTLHNKAAGNPFRRHRIRGAEGDEAMGEWTVRVRDDVERDTGRLARFALEMECR